MRYAGWLFVAILLACGCVSKGGDVTGSTLIDVQSTTTLVTLSSTKTTTTTLALIKPRIASLTQGPCPQDYTSSRYENEAYVSRSGGTLTVTHMLDYVCCANITVSVNATREGSLNVINLIEKNIGKVCRCICGYNITVAVLGVPSDGDYLIRVWGVEYGDAEVKLLASVSTKSAAEGGCVGLTADECTVNPRCHLSPWRCDYVPEGRTFDEVCPRGGKGVDCVPNDLRQEGEMCGGIAGFVCEPGLTCMLEGPYPDASGTCVKSQQIPYCSRDQDCLADPCVGDMCVNHDVAAAMEAKPCSKRPLSICYSKTSCDCIDGRCQWKQTPEYESCIGND